MVVLAAFEAVHVVLPVRYLEVVGSELYGIEDVALEEAFVAFDDEHVAFHCLKYALEQVKRQNKIKPFYQRRILQYLHSNGQ